MSNVKGKIKIADIKGFKDKRPFQDINVPLPTFKEIYDRSRCLYQGSILCPDRQVAYEIHVLWAQIRILYLYEELQKGNKLKPIILKNGSFIDGQHRIKAHIIHGDEEIEWTDEDETKTEDWYDYSSPELKAWRKKHETVS